MSYSYGQPACRIQLGKNLALDVHPYSKAEHMNDLWEHCKNTISFQILSCVVIGKDMGEILTEVNPLSSLT